MPLPGDFGDVHFDEAVFLDGARVHDAHFFAYREIADVRRSGDLREAVLFRIVASAFFPEDDLVLRFRPAPVFRPQPTAGGDVIFRWSFIPFAANGVGLDPGIFADIGILGDDESEA